MSRSAIYTAMDTPTVLLRGSVIPVGNVIRRFGCDIGVANNSISLKQSGYYKISSSVTADATAIGNVGMRLTDNGVPIQGAYAETTATAAGDTVNLTIETIVRKTCCCDSDTIQMVIGDGATVYNAAVTVVRL